MCIHIRKFLIDLKKKESIRYGKLLMNLLIGLSESYGILNIEYNVYSDFEDYFFYNHALRLIFLKMSMRYRKKAIISQFIYV